MKCAKELKKILALKNLCEIVPKAEIVCANQR